MITATQFSSSHNSFWSNCFPALENYVRLINSGGYEREFLVLDWKVDAHRSSLVSEAAFCLSKSATISTTEAFREAELRLSQLPGIDKNFHAESELESRSAEQLSSRLKAMLSMVIGRQTPFEFEPNFKGLGILGHAVGDFRTLDHIVEVKSVDRGFRSSDFRQILTYFLMDFCENNTPINLMSIVNPRRGIYFSQSVQDFFGYTTGLEINDVMLRFLAAVGSAGASR